jgi:hypothetical protein
MEVLMKLNIKAVAIAEAIVGAALFILCRLAFVSAPAATVVVLKYVTHNDWSSMAMPVTLGGFVGGVLAFTIFMAGIGAAWAWIYNRFAAAASA